MSTNRIHLLPDSVANQIAAGEVIQRPASVIKELMENSIDAGATDIKVIVQDAGRTQIQVIDDGAGMNETDARLAFERHATSKITSAQDIYSLTTMGFRGEALASIAAVAQVELLTRQEGEDLGIKVVIAGSEVTEQEPCATAKGSRFSVKNLFYNVPARRRFLKSDAAEMRHVVTEFLRVALAHPGVSMSLTSNGVVVYNLQAGNVKQRVAGVAGLTMAKNLLSLESETSMVRISGFIGRPETAKKSGGDQYFFANDRYMRSAYFNKAVTDAYKGIIPSDHLPAYYIYINVDPQSLDVNVHPQKTEIKFDDDQAIWKILNATIRACLNDNNILPQIDFDSRERVEIPTFDPKAADTYNPFALEREQAAQYATTYGTGARPSGGGARGWETIYESALGKGAPTASYSIESRANAPTQMGNNGTQDEAPARLFMPADDDLATLTADEFRQYKRRYILRQTEAGLMIIDQHRAHERILYDRMRAMMEMSAVESQRLLFPEVVAMGAEDLCVITELEQELSQAGMEVTVDSEGGTVSIGAIPAMMDTPSARALLESLAYDCRTGEVDVRGDVREFVARELSRHSAMAYGKELSGEEMAEIYKKLMSSANRQTTPDGRRVMRVITDEELEKMFD